MNKTFVFYYLIYLAFILTLGFGFSNNPDLLKLIESTKSSISNYGALSPIVYIFIVSFAILIPPLPDVPFILAGGVSFPFFVGVISTIIAFFISATINFYIGRYFTEKVLKLLTTKNDRSQINSFSEYINTRSVLIFRSLPGVSFGLVSYASGISNLSYKKYLIATMIPTVIYIFLIFYFINEIIYSTQTLAIISLFSVLVLVVFPLLLQINSFKNWIKMTK